VGSAAVTFFAEKGFDVVGIDNDSRKLFFGEEASTKNTGLALQAKIGNFSLHEVDIRDFEAIGDLFRSRCDEISAIIHCAAQPSHDWAARDPMTDFAINAVGTLNLLEATKMHLFTHQSCNKYHFTVD
jgi:CDP-paratose 2-epimerase